MTRLECASYPISIFIAGSYGEALYCAQEYCDKVGFCVTVTRSHYIYTDGSEQGLIIGLINYPRFPLTPDQIWERAETLAELLRKNLGQDSYTIQAPDKAVTISYREQVL